MLRWCCWYAFGVAASDNASAGGIIGIVLLVLLPAAADTYWLCAVKEFRLTPN